MEQYSRFAYQCSSTNAEERLLVSDVRPMDERQAPVISEGAWH